jgi:hypothetical protein
LARQPTIKMCKSEQKSAKTIFSIKKSLKRYQYNEKSKKYHSIRTDKKYHSIRTDQKYNRKNTTLSEQIKNTIEKIPLYQNR